MTNQCYYFSVRWSVEHSLENKAKLYEVFASDCEHFVFQAEETTYEGKRNPHYQCYCKVKEKIRAVTLANRWQSEDGLKGIHVSVCSNNGKGQLRRYCMKAESRVDGPWADKVIYMGRDLIPYPCMYAWQRAVVDYFNSDPDDRVCVWVFDERGGSGKSKLAKYLGYHKLAVGLGYGKASDLLNLASKMPSRGYTFDLTRCKPAHDSMQDIYAAMEGVKNGYFVNTKYETCQVIQDVAHVIVFANFLPERKCLSADRWSVYRLDAKVMFCTIGLDVLKLGYCDSREGPDES